jgi:glutamine synthetase
MRVPYGTRLGQIFGLRSPKSERLAALIHPEDLTTAMGAFQHGLLHPDETVTLEFRFRHRDGSWISLEACGQSRLDDPDIAAIPDLDSLTLVPWQPNLARFACDVTVEGEAWPYCPRTILRGQLARAKALGYEFKLGIELEYFLVRRNEDGSIEVFDKSDTLEKPCYDMAGLTRQYEFLTTVSRHCNELGWGNYANDHEDANGQFEQNFAYDDALVSCDRAIFFRYMVHTLAEQAGMIATFMPKPFMGYSANGHHHNLSLMSDEGENVLAGDLKGACELSELGVGFLAGLVEHADALTLVGAPTANSYKRFWDVGFWAPFHKSYGFNNRSCLFRISDVGRIEARHPDASCNPYLTIASCLVAGLDGIRRGLDPGEPIQDNMMKAINVPREERIPITLTEAIEAFKADDLMRELFRPRLYEAFLGAREDELNRFWSQVSPWELDFYLERWP